MIRPLKYLQLIDFGFKQAPEFQYYDTRFGFAGVS